ncbi:MAG: hypothetical protein M3R05_05955 [Chloroflexota bacterium]|nr:hypothetical protein [Chloroflexota bacterium]
MVRFLLPDPSHRSPAGLGAVAARGCGACPRRRPNPHEDSWLQIRHGVLGALLLAVAVALGSSTGTNATPAPDPKGQPSHLVDFPTHAPVGAARGELSERVGGATGPRAAYVREGTAASIAGIGSNYAGTAGFLGVPSVALPGAIGGRYTGAIHGYVTVCADRCARLPIVDWCDCYWGGRDQRVVDISHAAWPLITDQPLSRGLIQVRLVIE